MGLVVTRSSSLLPTCRRLEMLDSGFLKVDLHIWWQQLVAVGFFVGLFWTSLRTADAFPVVASLPPSGG